MESVLELYILSLIGRSIETAYDLQVQGRISLGSSVPALKRLEAAGYIKRKVAVLGARKSRQGYAVTTAGRKRLTVGLATLLSEEPPSEIDSILRVLELWRLSGLSSAGIQEFLERATVGKTRQSKTLLMNERDRSPGLEYLACRRDWDLIKLRSEIKFLAELARKVI